MKDSAENNHSKMVLYPSGVLRVLCLMDPNRVGHPIIRDGLIRFQVKLQLAVHNRRRLGDTRRFGEIATGVCSVALVEKAIADAEALALDGETFICRVLDEQIEHMG